MNSNLFINFWQKNSFYFENPHISNQITSQKTIFKSIWDRTNSNFVCFELLYVKFIKNKLNTVI